MVLKLDPAEHRHLFVLARGHPPADPLDSPAVIDARLQAVLDALPYPAYAATSKWTVGRLESPPRVVFADYEARSGRERNIVWMAFTDPDHRRMAVNWEEQARSRRRSSARARGCRTSARIGTSDSWPTLPELSPEFRAWWPQHDVSAGRTPVPSSTTTPSPAAWRLSQ